MNLLRRDIGIYDTIIYPSYLRLVYMIAPSFYDEISQIKIDVLLICALIIVSSIYILWQWSRWFEFDSLTWDPTVIFSMIISLANPRSPNRTGEYVMFITVIAVGFFFGCELILGMTSLSVTRHVERPVETLHDMCLNNISSLMMLEPKR